MYLTTGSKGVTLTDRFTVLTRQIGKVSTRLYPLYGKQKSPVSMKGVTFSILQDTCFIKNMEKKNEKDLKSNLLEKNIYL